MVVQETTRLLGGVVVVVLVRLVVMMIGWLWLWWDKIRELGIERTSTRALP